MKPILYLEDDLFTEDELCDTKSIISQYFEIKPISLNHLITGKPSLKQDVLSTNVRCSLSTAHYLGYRFEYASALKWVSYFREYLIDINTHFNDINYFANFYTPTFPLFLRPVSPFKTFTGQVFNTYEDFIKEYNFLKQNKNISDDLLCMVSNFRVIGKEYRCVFIDKKYITGSQYMEKDELTLSEDVPQKVIDFASKLSKMSFFDELRNYVIDIENREGLDCRLVEINGFETSSFYKCDLHKIYTAWSQNKLK